jgi:hypothetical protein
VRSKASPPTLSSRGGDCKAWPHRYCSRIRGSFFGQEARIGRPTNPGVPTSRIALVISRLDCATEQTVDHTCVRKSVQLLQMRELVFLEECWKDFPGPCILTLVGWNKGAGS